MPTESQIMSKVHEIDKRQGEDGVRIDNLESWVADIHKTLKATDRKVMMGVGAFIAIEFISRLWGK